MPRVLQILTFLLLLTGCYPQSESACLSAMAEDYCERGSCKPSSFLENGTGYRYWGSGANSEQLMLFTESEILECEGGRWTRIPTRWNE